MPWPKTDAEHLLVTADQMASLENEILASGLPEEALMEKVGQAMAAWLIKYSRLIDDGVVVLVGPGHNGGDGLVVARELHLAGVKVEIWCPLTIKKKLTAKHLSHANWLGVPKLKKPPNVAENVLWIDSLFGLAQSRSLPKLIANLFKERQLKTPGRLVSLDVPSGICSDSGKPFSGGAASAAFTLTVGLIKQGLVQDLAMSHVGHVVRIDLGFSSMLFEGLPNQLPLSIKSSDLSQLDWPTTALSASKYLRGRLLVVAGSDKYRGAALLALKGSLASGAGSIQAAIPKVIANALWQVAPEVVIAGELGDSPNGALAGSFLEKQTLSKFDALLIGPGLGNSQEDWLVVAEILQAFDGLLVLDADALNRLAMSPDGWHWIKRRNAPTWITPHSSEFFRLFPDIQKASPLDAAREAARLSGAGVLLKGAHSVIADPKGMSWQLVHTAPWVARTGLGDLLAGFCAGVGAMAMASEREISCEVLAASALMHVEASLRCKKGSSPSLILESLEALTKNMQSNKLDIEPFNETKDIF